MEIPYYKQETNYTCGAAVMRMLLAYCGIVRTEKQVARLLRTNKVRGTWPNYFPEVAERFKLQYRVARNADIGDIQEALSNQYAVVVSYILDPAENTQKSFSEMDHYAVARSVEGNSIFLMDPYYGEEHKRSLTWFKRRWRSSKHFDNEARWFFSVKR